MPHRFFVICDILSLAVINIVIWASLYIQFAQYQLPCPLCLEQRMGLFGISLGYVFNLYFGVKARHYAISTVISLLIASIAMIQILMHIVPDTGSYGSPFMGLHLYTWVFIICIAITVWNLILIVLLNELLFIGKTSEKAALIVVIPLMLCILVNVIASFAECGLNRCPTDPKSYWINTFLKDNTAVNPQHHGKTHHTDLD
ncbi:MAG: disulfide bond formation protein [Burkholderiales bacterium]|jgi:disulfide bond formation protein DsbB|nr:disulfide bond formation protein [Burkholderiales bacterium]